MIPQALPILELQGAAKAYRIYDQPADRLKQMLWGNLMSSGYGSEFWALHPLDLQVHRGEAVAIIGRNGSGKSTLLQLVSGILAPTNGSVTVRGRIAALLELGSGFNPECSGRENIYLNATVLGLSRAEIDERLERIVSFADIGEFIDRPVKTYSSGMYVRLAFSVAIHVDPDILIVDEALAVGDIAFVGKCLMAVDAFRRRGGTLLVVSHDMGLVKNLTQRAVFLERGHLRHVGEAVAVADLYLQSLGEVPDGTPASTFADDDAAASITSLLFLGDGSAAKPPATQIRIGIDGRFDLRCDITVARRSSAEFAISFYDSTKRIVAAERVPVVLAPGEGRSIIISVDRMLLVPGTYTINVSLRQEGTRAYMSWMRDACTLIILGNEPIPRVYRQPMRVLLQGAA